MAILLYLAFFLSTVQADSTSEQELIRESKEQAQIYVSHILNRQDEPEHVWALAALADAHPQVNRYIAESIAELQVGPSYLKEFADSATTYGDRLYRAAQETGSPLLLLAWLLDEKDEGRKREVYAAFEFSTTDSPIDYEELIRRVLDQEELNEQVLPAGEFSLANLLLFYYSAGRNVLPDELTRKLAAGSITRNTNDRSLTATLHGVAGFLAHYDLSQYSRALDYYNLLLEDDRLPNSKFRMNIYVKLEYAMNQLGSYDRSLEIIRKFTLPLSGYLGQEETKQLINLGRGINFYALGKIEEAQEAYLEVQDAIDRQNILNQYHTVLFNNLALTYLKSGNFDRYLNLQHRAYEIADSMDSYTDKFSTLRNLFIFHRDHKNADLAQFYLNEARSIAENENDVQDLALVDLYSGSFHKNITGNFREARFYFSQAEENLNREDDFDLFQQLKFEQARLLEMMDRPEEAISIYHEIIGLSQTRENSRSRTEAYIKKANLHLEMGQIDSARAGILLYTEADLSGLNFHRLVQAKTVEADYLIHKGNPGQALELLNPVITQVVEWVQESTDLETGFWNVRPEFLEVFRLTANLHIDSGNPEKAVMVLDQLKSINDASLYQNPLVRSRQLSESELTQYQRITAEMDQLRKQLLSTESENMGPVQQRLDQLNARKRVMDRKISSATDRTPISLRSVQSRLSAYERVLHITELDDRFYIATISRSDVEFRTVPLDTLNRRLFEISIQQVADKETDLNNLYEIARILGVDKLDRRIKTVTVIPDSYLYQLPLDILPVTPPENPFSYGESTYFVERVETRYLTSLDDFRPPSDTREYENGFSGFGISSFEEYNDRNLVPLPFAGREVLSISNTLSNIDRKSTYLDTASTEARFNRIAPGSRILHLATHSEVSDRDPLFSRFYMSQHVSDDPDEFPGQVFAYELFELNLGNDLIMLNSCESGSGSYLQGSGVMGISRALRYAGAHTLVLNLWSVNDMMASEFAVRFYEGLNAGQSKSEALRNTKLHFLKEKNGNPHYWGPYMLLGEVDPIVQPDQPIRNIVAGSFMLYFMIIIAASLLARKRPRTNQSERASR